MAKNKDTTNNEIPIEKHWNEIGVEGVRPAFKSPERLIDRYESCVRDSFLNVYYFEIGIGLATAEELRNYKREIENVRRDNSGGDEHEWLMASVCWHVEYERGRDYDIGGFYDGCSGSFDVADEQRILYYEVGDNWDSVKPGTLFQDREYRSVPMYSQPEPNGIERVGWVPYPEQNTFSKDMVDLNPNMTLPLYIFTKSMG